MEKYAQTCSTVVWYNIFNAITLFINITIAKAQAQYHTRCQYELVFSKWPTIVKILCGFLPLSAGYSDFLKIKKPMRQQKWMWSLMINQDIFYMA